MSMDAIDAKFEEHKALAVREGASALSTAAPEVPNAERMVANLQEWERFKGLAIREKDWLKIPGVKGRYLPAAACDRIAPAIGISWEIVSKDERGNPGVFSQITEQLTYGTKKIMRWNKWEKREEEVEVPDHTKPIKTLATLYTVTVRCSDRFGRHVDIEGSFSSLEMPKSDYHARQQALARARRVGTLRLLGGVDEEVFEEERARIEYEKRAAAEQAAKVPSGGQLFQRAKSLGLVKDGSSFRTWCAATVPGCEEATDETWQPSVPQRTEIARILEELGQ